MTRKKPPEEPRGRPGRPPGGKPGKSNQTCPNGHRSNSDGKCFESTCVHYQRRGQ